MNWLGRIFRTLRQKDHQRDMEEELQFHLSMREQNNLAHGMAAQEARRNARLRFGNPAVWLERLSEIDLAMVPRSILEDLRFGVRQLCRNPGFTLTASLTLALGVGLNTAIFSVADAVLLRPLPWPDADRMIAIYERVPKFGVMNDSWPDYQDWRSQSHSFSKMAALQPSKFNLNFAGEEQQIPGAAVTDSFFDLFGSSLSVGRSFTTAESIPGAGLTAVVSYEFWQHFFGGDPNALGRSLQLDGQTATLVGVLSPQFKIPYGPYQIFVPFGTKANSPEVRNRANHPGLQVIAELSPGVKAAAAQSEMDSIMQRLALAYPDSDKDESVVMTPLMDQFVGRARNMLMILLSASGLVLLLACANLANMCLARAATRQREYSVRASLGAGRWRLFRQALIENLPLALLGGAGGIGLAALLVKPLVHRYPHQLFRLEDSRLDLAVVCFAAVVALGAWLTFGIVPALVAARRRDVYSSIRTSASGSVGSSSRSRLRSLLLTLEIAMALIVTISTGLLLRSLEAVAHVDPGFRPDHLLVLEGVHAHGPAPENAVFYRGLIDRLRHLPGVENASAVMELPLKGAFWTSPYVPDGHAESPNSQQPWTKINFAMPGYFQTMGMSLRSGRFFADTDAESTPFAVINETMARSLPQKDPIGRQIYVEYAPHPAMQIVGVVADEKQFGLEQNNMPEVFIPATQLPFAAMDLVLRTTTEPTSIAGAAAAMVHDFDSRQSPPRAVTMESLLDSDLADRKFVSLLFTLFDGLAVILAVVGVAGVISYTVQQRSREIGLRMALGAKKREVVGMIVFAHGAKPALLGVLIGIAGGAALTRLLAHQLYGVKPRDPVSFGLASLVLIGATLIASYIPARRAAQVDPTVTLRCE
jgi:putative ABC transport system permease protein